MAMRFLHLAFALLFSLASGYQLPLTPRAVTAATCSARAGVPLAVSKDEIAEREFQATKAMQELRRDPIEYEIQKNKRRYVEMATQAALQGNIPSDWGSALDEEGDRYFWDEETKTATYNPQEMIDEMVSMLEDQKRKEMQELMDSL